MTVLKIFLSLFQSLDRKNNEDVDTGSLAYRTRSKRPLVDIPLDQLEAELLPPDITEDMYEHRDEDRNWTKWLKSLMTADNEGQRSSWVLKSFILKGSSLLMPFPVVDVCQRRPTMKTTPSITSWRICMNRTWRITGRTAAFRSPVRLPADTYSVSCQTPPQ